MLPLVPLRSVLGNLTIQLNQHLYLIGNEEGGGLSEAFICLSADEAEDIGAIRFNEASSHQQMLACQWFLAELQSILNMSNQVMKFTHALMNYLSTHCGGNIHITQKLGEQMRDQLLDQWMAETESLRTYRNLSRGTFWGNVYVYPDNFANLADNIRKSNDSSVRMSMDNIMNMFQGILSSFYALRRVSTVGLVHYSDIESCPADQLIPDLLLFGVENPTSLEEAKALLTFSWDELLKFSWDLLHALGLIRPYPNITLLHAWIPENHMMRNMFEDMAMKVPDLNESRRDSFRSAAHTFSLLDAWEKWALQQRTLLQTRMMQLQQTEIQSLIDAAASAPPPQVIEYSNQYGW